MKRVLNDLTPLPGNDLFITQYWFCLLYTSDAADD